MTQLGLNLVSPPELPIRELVTLLEKHCQDCQLGILKKTNAGFLWRGSPEARIALIGGAPSKHDIGKKMPFSHLQGLELDRWLEYLRLDFKKDVFILNTVQCQPPLVLRKGKKKREQRDPDSNEIGTCFGTRALRVLQALPNLEMVVALGWIAAKALLGGDPKPKTHEGVWLESSLLPGIPIFCMQEPDWVVQNRTPERNGRVRECLGYIKREQLREGRAKRLAEAARKAREQ